MWCFAIGETIVWASFYYIFPALLLAWERDLRWSKAELTGAFTLSLVVFAVLAPLAGRLIDRGHARTVFAGSTLLGALALIALAKVSALWQFYAVWLILGVSMAGSLYEACFAVLTRLTGNRSRRAITLVTLVAGLAGTVSFPGANVLTQWIGWRDAVMIFGLTVIVVALPLIWIGCSIASRQGEMNAPPASPHPRNTLRALRNPIFWLLALSFAMVTLDHSMLITHLLPLLDERGIEGQTAILAASTIGPMQVVGRLLMVAVEKHVSTLIISVGCCFAMLIATLALLGSASIPILLVAFVLFQGAGIGVTSIARPVITAEFLGRVNFGVVSGLIAVPVIGATAIAPSLGSLIWLTGGYDRVIYFALCATALGCIALITAGRLYKQQHAQIR